MTGALPPGDRSPGTHGGGSTQDPDLFDARDLWSRDVGRGGAVRLVTLDRAMRARELSQPDLEDEQVVDDLIDELLARIDGRRLVRSSASQDSLRF